MTPDEAREVAGRLTKAQTEALQDDLLSLRTGVSRVRGQLYRLGLVEVSGVRNGKGDQVIRMLQENRDGE